MARIDALGDSLVVAGGGTRLRLHVHTNTPQGSWTRRRVSARSSDQGRRHDPAAARRRATRTIAVVTDSTCDLPDGLAHQLGVVRVPLVSPSTATPTATAST